MASNHFGTLFRITTWGESHGKAIGVVIDGCPAGLPLSDDEINAELALRQPGRTAYVTPRGEKDIAEICSGVFEGKTTGAPISIIIFNKDADSSKYEPIKDLLRPGHANFTYLEKYGIFDYRGGGRSSARETACRVAAGAVAKKLLATLGIQVVAFIKEIGGIAIQEPPFNDPAGLQAAVRKSPVFCPDEAATEKIIRAIEQVKEEGDSLGGVIEAVGFNLPAGLGDPVYEKLEGNLAKAMLSIPATKGFEIGSGFQAARMKGSEHNDQFIVNAEGKITKASNLAGGTLGGISTGMPLIVRVPFKPTSSIMKPQKTVSTQGEEKEFKIPEGSRHDPCVTIRAVPIVEAMMAIVLADSLLLNRCSKI
ncbi:MAG: chorismate synthase [Verrucomicrobia bacterium]|nr:chorismate synthase [Verrucomicrobiota bacterium]